VCVCVCVWIYIVYWNWRWRWCAAVTDLYCAAMTDLHCELERLRGAAEPGRRARDCVQGGWFEARSSSTLSFRWLSCDVPFCDVLFLSCLFFSFTSALELTRYFNPVTTLSQSRQSATGIDPWPTDPEKLTHDTSYMTHDPSVQPRNRGVCNTINGIYASSWNSKHGNELWNVQLSAVHWTGLFSCSSTVGRLIVNNYEIPLCWMF